MTESDQNSEGESPEDQLHDEPDFDAPVDAEDEANRIDAVHARNRQRVLIPLVLLIALFGLLSLFGEQGKKEEVQQSPVEEQAKP